MIIEHTKQAAGCVFICANTDRILLNLRAEHKSHKLSWGFWGGMMETGELPKDCLVRELSEEMGFVPEINKTYPFDVYHSNDERFIYYSFISVVNAEFSPILNQESAGYGWFNIGVWPNPLHSGVKRTLASTKSLQKIKLIIDQHK